MLVPSSAIDPSCGWYTPLRQLKIDVLPAPLGPMMANSSPAETSKLTPFTAVTPAKDSFTSWKERSGPFTRATASFVCNA